MNEYKERLENLKNGIRHRREGAIRQKDYINSDNSKLYWDGFIQACDVILSDDIDG